MEYEKKNSDVYAVPLWLARSLSLSLSSFRRRPRPAFTRTQYVSDCTNVLCTFCVYDYLFHRRPTIIMPVPASASMPSRHWCYNEREKRVTTPRRARTVGLRRFICSGGRLLFHYYLYLYFFFHYYFVYTHEPLARGAHFVDSREKNLVVIGTQATGTPTPIPTIYNR